MREPKRLIVVLGMHRSGTSAVTRALEVIGVQLGDHLMPGIASVNDKGFWEDLDINALNIEMLSVLQSDWHELAPYHSSAFESLRQLGYIERATHLLQEKTSTTDVFGFKDPRVAKLLPFWQEVFKRLKYKVSYVLTLRHPLSVVASLFKRDTLDADQSYLLWLSHMIPSLRASTTTQTVLIDYDHLIHAPSKEITRLASRLELKVDQSKQQSFISDFLDQNLRHTFYPANALAADPGCPPLVQDVYLMLQNVANDTLTLDDPRLQASISQWSEEFERMSAALRLADKLLRENVRNLRALAQLDENMNALKQSVAQCTPDATIMQTLNERDQQLAATEQRLSEQDIRLQNMLSSRSWRITQPVRWCGECLRNLYTRYL